MSHIPHEVALRLQELSGTAMAIENPNFTVDDLQYHQPRVDVGAARGSWAHNGVEFEFRLIGQVSAHQTFLQDYGDMFQHKDKARYAGNSGTTLTDIVRAKWKLTVAVPHDLVDNSHRQILLRQFQALLDIEAGNFESPWAAGQGKKASFAFLGNTQWRASAVTENIYQPFKTQPNGYVPASQYDSQNLVAALPSDGRTSLFVRPLEFFDFNAQPVPDAQIPVLFRQGAWVELSCRLVVWNNLTAKLRPTRSYHIEFDGVQHIVEGRLKEPPLTTPVVRAGEKRKFASLRSAGGGGDADGIIKVARFGDVVMG